MPILPLTRTTMTRRKTNPQWEKKKRTASIHLEAESPKRGKTPLPEESTAAADSGPEWDPRVQPLVNS